MPHSPDSRPHNLKTWLELLGALGLLFVTTILFNGEPTQPARLPLVVVSAVAVFLIVSVRRDKPSLVLVVLAAVTALQPGIAMLTAVAAYSGSRRIGTVRRRAVTLACAVVAMLASFSLLAVEHHDGWRYGLALGTVFAGLTVVVPALVGTSAGQQDNLVEALRERTVAAEEARRNAESASRMQERSRIAAEMHDLVGHRLSLISLHAGGLELALMKQAPGLLDEAAQVRQTTRDAMNELREVLGVLGPLKQDTGTTALTDATGTRPDIQALADESCAAGVPVVFTWEGDDVDTLDPRVRRAVHRVVREALTNIHRYAPGAQVTVSVVRTEDQVQVAVVNAAPPSPPEATTGLGTGRGLMGLRERVSLGGGELSAGPTAQGGYAVRATVSTSPGAVAALPGEPLVGTIVGPAPPSQPETPEPRLFSQRLATGITAFFGLAALGLLLILGVLLVGSADTLDNKVAYKDVELGMTQDAVQGLVGMDDPAVHAAATGQEPLRHPGASCIYPSTTSGKERKGFRIVRYCFKNNRLMAIDRFTVPLSSEEPAVPGATVVRPSGSPFPKTEYR